MFHVRDSSFYPFMVIFGTENQILLDSVLLQYRILDVLMTVVEKYRCNRDIMYLVVKIIANLTCDPNISVYMKETGETVFLEHSFHPP